MTKKKPLPNLSRPECQSCAAYDPIEVDRGEKGRGYCKLNPAEIVAYDEDGNVITARPTMPADDWCLQHRPKIVN